MLLNCGVGETLESPLDYKEIQPVHSEGDQPWGFFGRNDANTETPVLWPPHVKSWLIGWEGLGARGEGDDRGWDGWMASLTRWLWVWVNSRSWWWTGRPGMLRFMGSQRVGHDWATELNWTFIKIKCSEGKEVKMRASLMVGSVIENPSANARDLSLIPGLERSHMLWSN